MNFLASVVLLLLGASIGYASVPARTPRIAEGEEAKRGQFPYQVALTLKRQTLCGGVIINENFFLTAAHCFFNGQNAVPVEELKVYYGSEKLFSGGKYNRVKTVHFHEEYDHGFQYDLALVEVKRKFEFSFTAQPATFGTETFGEALPATVSGYGRPTAEGNMGFRLRYAQLTSLTDAECREATGDNYYQGIFCLDTTTGAGLCTGDYGAPAVAEEFLVGVGSYTVGGKCETGLPDVFVDVGFFSAWIQSKLEAEQPEA